MTHQPTPGPWYVGRQRGNPEARDVCALESETGVAIIVASVGGWSTGETDANAHLIAAAPELLAALQAGLRAKTCPCCGRDNSAYPDGCTSDDCPGVAAIAKAQET